MKAFKELEYQNLQWTQPSSWKSHYELRNEAGDVVATMTKPSWWKSLVEVDAPGNRWTFERKGWWKRKIVIESVGTGDEPAEFRYTGMSMSAGVLEFADGRTFHWKQSNFWATKWGWVTPEGAPIVGIETGGFFRINADIVLDPDVLDMPSVALLIFLGWYLYTLYYQDVAAASGA